MAYSVVGICVYILLRMFYGVLQVCLPTLVGIYAVDIHGQPRRVVCGAAMQVLLLFFLPQTCYVVVVNFVRGRR